MIFLTIIAMGIATAQAATRVKGHYNKKTGTYVASHYRSSADKSKYNNYSTKGNVNPYTGKKGYKSPNKKK